MADSTVDVPPAQGITVQFFNWHCGHHQQCPDPIHGLASVEQAELILRAIGAAISQPDSARAWVIDGDRARKWYITDDHASECTGEGGAMPVVLLFGADADLTLSEQDKEELQDAYSCWGTVHTNWDGNTWLEDGDIALTKLSATEIKQLPKSPWGLPVRIEEEGARRLGDVLAEAASFKFDPDEPEDRDPSLDEQVAAPTNDADGLHGSSAAAVVSPQEHDCITVLGGFKDLPDFLASGANSINWDHMDSALRVVGVVVRGKDVHAALTHIRQMDPAIGRHGDADDKGAAIDDGVEGQSVAPVIDGDERADDLQDLPPLVVRIHSVIHVPGVRDWSNWAGHPVVLRMASEADTNPLEA
jgi:hypothetical protein